MELGLLKTGHTLYLWSELDIMFIDSMVRADRASRASQNPSITFLYRREVVIHEPLFAAHHEASGRSCPQPRAT